MLPIVCNLKSTREILTVIMLKSIGLFCTLNGSLLLMHFWFCNIMHWSFGKYRLTELCGFFKRLHILLLYNIKKGIFVNITTNFIKKILKYWKLSSSCWQLYFFQTSHFPLKFQALSSNKYCQLFSLIWQGYLSSFSRKYLPNLQLRIVMVC